MMEMAVTMTVDNVDFSAQVPLGATLRQFLVAVGLPATDAPLTDGSRLFAPDIELAHRLHDSVLSSTVPSEMLLESPALVASELLVLVGHDAL